mgnify:CR=1 FL=1
MKIIVTGCKGQLGTELLKQLQEGRSELGPIPEKLLNATVIPVDLPELDISNYKMVDEFVRRNRPDIIINCAAYTNVDGCEVHHDDAFKANALGPRNLAQAAEKTGARLVHVSTDYVFDGAGSHYRREDEATGPLNVYGETKRAGELALEQGNPRHLIFRTSWVYATRGANFAKTMLRLAGEKETLSIIDDQHGAPTGAELLADCTATAIRETLRDPALAGTYHLVASGETSWCDYARYVFEVARAHGAELAVQEVKGIPTTAYPTPAKRPLNSRLSNEKFQQAFGVTLPDWRQGVARVVTEVLGK